MTQLKTRAIWTLCIWVPVMIGFCFVFFSQGGPSTFLDGEQRVTLTRIFFTMGMIVYFTMLYLTRRGKTLIVKDERDELIEKRAMAIGFYVLLFYVFFVCLFLYWFYKIHQETVVMPVGWIWFLGISCYFMGFISHASATLILVKRMSGNAE
ncbi:hypothetical protein ACFLRW_04905 [Acidobacteriota bacterium]